MENNSYIINSNNVICWHFSCWFLKQVFFRATPPHLRNLLQNKDYEVESHCVEHVLVFALIHGRLTKLDQLTIVKDNNFWVFRNKMLGLRPWVSVNEFFGKGGPDSIVFTLIRLHFVIPKSNSPWRPDDVNKKHSPL